jgi:hypothetical protein
LAQRKSKVHRQMHSCGRLMRVILDSTSTTTTTTTGMGGGETAVCCKSSQRVKRCGSRQPIRSSNSKISEIRAACAVSGRLSLDRGDLARLANALPGFTAPGQPEGESRCRFVGLEAAKPEPLILTSLPVFMHWARPSFASSAS